MGVWTRSKEFVREPGKQRREDTPVPWTNPGICACSPGKMQQESEGAVWGADLLRQM